MPRAYRRAALLTAEERAAMAAKRRRQLAEAQRRGRARGREEAEALRRENEALRGERDEALRVLRELEASVACAAGDDDDDVDAAENALLRSEIKQHELFLRTVLGLAGAADVDDMETAAVRAVARQTMDAAMDRSMRFLAESLHWVDAAPTLIPHGLDTDAYKATARVRATGLGGSGPGRVHRLDIDLEFSPGKRGGAIPMGMGLLARRVRDTFLEMMSDAATLRTVLVSGELVVPGTTTLPQSDVDVDVDITTVPSLTFADSDSRSFQTNVVRESRGASLRRDWVLMVCPHNASMSASLLRGAESAAGVVDAYVMGLCISSNDTHGDDDVPKDGAERVSCDLLEAIYVWEEEGGLAEKRVVHVSQLVVLGDAFAVSALGNVFALTSASTNAPNERCPSVVALFLEKFRGLAV